MSDAPLVLVSWVAKENDPFARGRGNDGHADAPAAFGPTLTLLFDEQSPYRGRIRNVVLLYREAPEGPDESERQVYDAVVQAIGKRDPNVHVEPIVWSGEDPTDHVAIFAFLRDEIPKIRRRFAERELLIHVSPGTPSMHTIWVLMGETGFIQPPFQLVKSYRARERRQRPAVVPVEIGIETFYKAYMATRPRQVTSEEQALLWDPSQFQSTRMKQLFAEARRFAHLNVPILILGERGTGKTTLAGWIRLHSPYRDEHKDRGWPAVACGQYSPETMRAELFGYVKGAFTDAKKDRDGLLTAAHGDTLFLDEVGDVSRDLQRLLIKALEEKQFFRVGDDSPRKSDFRLLTATNLPAEELGERLEPDFLDRISLLTLHLPPLREVPEELSWLWRVIYDQAARRAGARSREVHLGDKHHLRVVRQLEAHPLPGNLRDLFRVAYRIVAARSDPHQPLAPGDAVDYGLAVLTGVGSSGDSTSRAVARCFGEAAPLDRVLPSGARVETKTVMHDFKAYLAREIQRLSQVRQQTIGELCDVSERTLREWSGHADAAERNAASEQRKKSSGQRKKDSGSRRSARQRAAGKDAMNEE